MSTDPTPTPVRRRWYERVEHGGERFLFASRWLLSARRRVAIWATSPSRSGRNAHRSSIRFHSSGGNPLRASADAASRSGSADSGSAAPKPRVRAP